MAKYNWYDDAQQARLAAADEIANSGGGGSATVPFRAAAFYCTTSPAVGAGIQVPFSATDPSNFATSISPATCAADGTITFAAEATYCVTVNLILSDTTDKKLVALYNVGNGDYIAKNAFQEIVGGGVHNYSIFSRTLRIAAGDTFNVLVGPSTFSGGTVAQIGGGLTCINIDRVGN